MIAKELIQLLKQVSPETTIVIRGYEEGYNDIQQLKRVKIKGDTNGEWYYGEYLISEESDAVDAIELFGENKNKKN